MGRQPAVALDRIRYPNVSAGVVARKPVGRVACDDAIEIGRIALHFRQRLLAAKGTTLEIGMRRRRAVIGLNDRLARERHFVHAALAVVNDAIHAAQRPTSVIGAVGDVAGVRAAYRVSPVHGVEHGAIDDLAREAAVADSNILMVPLRWQPDFETEFGKNRTDDAAKCGNRARGDSAGPKVTRGNRSSGADRYPG